MALTCSVLGHAYGEPTVERDREERGSEVVVTVREYETCTRCGTTRVVSENKEVTAVEAEGEAGEQGDPITERTTDLDAPATNTDADAVGDAPVAEGAAVADDTGVDDASADVATADAEEPPDEGAEILDAEAGEPVEDETIDEELASPSVAEESAGEMGQDGSNDSAAEDEDAVVISGESSTESEERAPGEWPEEEDGGDDDWSPPSEPDEPADSSTSSPEPTVGSTVTVPEGEFHCEECAYTTPVEASSLRAGDFCPECHRGTLTHVWDAE